MAFFSPANSISSARGQRLFAIYEIIHTVVDFLAAALFFVGSVLFFDKTYETEAVWCFVIGSACFALKPTTRLAREIHLLALGRVEEIAEKAPRAAPSAPTNR